jgi:hypothetical protein
MSNKELVTTLIIVGIVGIFLSFLWPAKVEEEPSEDEVVLGGIVTTGTFPIPRLEDLLADRAPSPVAVGALAAAAPEPIADAQPGDPNDSPEGVDRA